MIGFIPCTYVWTTITFMWINGAWETPAYLDQTMRGDWVREGESELVGWCMHDEWNRP